MDLLNIDIEINFLISELNRPLVPLSIKIDLETRLSKLLVDRKLMVETLAKPNSYMPECIDDSSNTDD